MKWNAPVLGRLKFLALRAAVGLVLTGTGARKPCSG